jgi:predicted MFS family arabinose efflux permease
MSTSWSVSVLLGPLVGGLFAQLGSWRTAFVLTIIIAGILGISALLILPKTSANLPSSRVPGARIALICLAIAIMSWASLVEFALFKAGLIVLAMISLALMLQLNRSASTALLPRDSFLWGSPTGVGLWLALLLSVSYSPLQIFMPIFLQRLHGFAPLTAGFMVATASLAWTAASVATAGASAKWIDRLMLSGPTVMALSLALMSLLMANSPALLLIAVIALLGAGIGQCWPFVADRIMDGAKPGDETVAASSVATVQQMGFALGAAMAGVVGNASGLSSTIVSGGMARAAFWVPASFVLPAILALLMGLRLVHLRKS